MRVGRNVHLTPAGQRLADHAETALAEDEHVRGELAQISRGRASGTIRVSFVQTVALALLPAVVANLTDTAPDLRLELEQIETPPALEDLRARRIDLAVGIDYAPVPPPRYPDIDRLDLLEEDVLLAVPSRSPLSRKHPLTVQDLRTMAWAVGNRGGGHHAVTEYLCNRIGEFEPDVRYHTDDALSLRALVSSGHAVTLLPALIGTAAPGVTLRILDGVHLKRVIFTAVRASTTQTANILQVRDALTQAAREATTGRTDARVIQPTQPAW